MNYNPPRKKNLYDPSSRKPFRLSRSRLDNFLRCPRCFYLDRRLGIEQPPGFPFNLNSAVDELLKKEFDLHRTQQTRHPLLVENNIDAIPFAHDLIDVWRDSLRRGITFHHEQTNFLVTGGVDDLWQTPAGELLIVDYKATSKKGDVSLDAEWQAGYKRQVEIYQWLFRQNGFQVSDTAYFVYCNGDTSQPVFNQQLTFTIKLLPYVGTCSWVEDALHAAKQCLDALSIPQSASDCTYCTYHAALNAIGA